jgi:hypothetical protein
MELVAGVNPVFAWTLGVCSALIVIAAAWRAIINPLIHAARQIGRFLDDWYGRTDDLGRHNPGIRARLDAMEIKVDETHAQTQTNGGGSIKDAVNRIERNVHAIDHKLDMHILEALRRDDRISSHDERLDTIEHRRVEGPTRE